MQREEKQMELTLEAVLNRLNDLKISIGSMMHKLETEFETINWSTFLDNFAIISSHLTGLSKILSKELCPPLRNRTVLPLVLSQDRDESLVTITQGRLPVFSHDIVPDYLRTKPDPLAEQKILQIEQKAANLTPEAALKQTAQFSKVVSHILDMIVKSREEWELESNSRSGIQQTSSMTDTHALVAAVGIGKGLKISHNMVTPGQSSLMVPPSIRSQTPLNSVNMSGVGGTQLGKAPSAIKTNIKAAMQVHPFPRT